MLIAYLSLGSNIGDRLDYLTQATRLLNEHADINVTKISSVYETAAWGLEDQKEFYNIVLEIETNLPPKCLLEVCQAIEDELERTREIHWGPRTLDIDILLYEDIELEDERLTIPHKYLLERPFVTIPLAEIAPDISIKDTDILEVAVEHRKLEKKLLRMEFAVLI